MADRTQILIIDDHPIIGIAMDLLLAENFPNADLDRADGGKDGLKMLKAKKYDLIILDVNLPDYNILSLIPNIFNIDEEARILIFTMTPENILARRLFSMKVSGFLSKSVSDDEILAAIRIILKGGKYISQDFSSVVIGDFMEGKMETNPFDTLSEREYQILIEILEGESTKGISEKLHLHGSSVSTYRQRIFQKIGVSNQVELIKKAQIFGIID